MKLENFVRGFIAYVERSKRLDSGVVRDYAAHMGQAITLSPPALPDGWQPIASAPRDATWIEVWNGKEKIRAHWAQGGGEDQPPFGPAFFYAEGEDPERGPYCEVSPSPTHWRPETVDADELFQDLHAMLSDFEHATAGQEPVTHDWRRALDELSARRVAK